MIGAEDLGNAEARATLKSIRDVMELDNPASSIKAQRRLVIDRFREIAH
jgi:hypothetical protein